MGYIKVLDLKNEIEANLLSAALKERGIPHEICTMHDTAYNGIYQAFTRWGWLEAPDGDAEAIRAIQDDLNKSSVLKEEGEDDGQVVPATEESPEDAPIAKRRNGRLVLGLVLFVLVLFGLAAVVAVVSGRWGQSPRRHLPWRTDRAEVVMARPDLGPGFLLDKASVPPLHRLAAPLSWSA